MFLYLIVYKIKNNYFRVTFFDVPAEVLEKCYCACTVDDYCLICSVTVGVRVIVWRKESLGYKMSYVLTKKLLYGQHNPRFMDRVN